MQRSSEFGFHFRDATTNRLLPQRVLLAARERRPRRRASPRRRLHHSPEAKLKAPLRDFYGNIASLFHAVRSPGQAGQPQCFPTAKALCRPTAVSSARTALSTTIRSTRQVAIIAGSGANYLMADDHAKWFRASAVSAGVTNPTETDCNTAGVANANAQDPGDGITFAAGSGCSDNTIAATFSL